MKIELVSLNYNLHGQKRYDQVTSIINHSEAELILFCGHTFKESHDLDSLPEQINNTKPIVLFEVKSVAESSFVNLRNCLYILEKGNVRSLFTNQFFATSQEIENNETLCERFINELETRRQITIMDKNCLIFQCGEINIVKNIQKEGNRPVFRLSQRKDLMERFEKVLNNTNIILNPIHTPMGNQGKMEKRREFFSDNNRFYFSTSQNGTRVVKGEKKAIPMDADILQYAFYNKKALKETQCDVNSKNYTLRIFDI